MSNLTIKKNSVQLRDSGFTIIETMFAILVLSIGLTPMLYLLTTGTKITDDIKTNIVAANLLQEELEIIYSLKINNLLMCNDFSTGLVGGPWLVDYSTEWTNCASRNLVAAGVNPPVLKISPVGLYNYAGGSDTIFRRTATITSANGGNELIISAIVYWSAGNITMAGCPVGTRCIKAEHHLYNWR